MKAKRARLAMSGKAGKRERIPEILELEEMRALLEGLALREGCWSYSIWSRVYVVEN
jgi:hypothetical protein